MHSKQRGTIFSRKCWKIKLRKTRFDEGTRKINAPEEDKKTWWFTGSRTRTLGVPFLAGNVKAGDEGKHIENCANGGCGKISTVGLGDQMTE